MPLPSDAHRAGVLTGGIPGVP